MPVEATPAEAVPMEATPVEAEPVEAEAIPMEPVAPPAPPAAPPPAAAKPAPPPPAAAPPTAAPAAAAAPAVSLAGKEPKLMVMRGQKPKMEYPIYEGQNFVGRADEKPVDIDLEDQEPPDRVWSSRQHACIFFENGELSIEDLNSSNGTFVNRARIYPGQKKTLNVNDVIQIGTVQLKVVV
jgi:pSer/pThr/pTyr-binding forkhead associated (FHA) protein